MCHTEDFSTVSDAAVGGGDLVAGVTPRLASEDECKGGLVFTEQLRVESEGGVDLIADSTQRATCQPAGGVRSSERLRVAGARAGR